MPAWFASTTSGRADTRVAQAVLLLCVLALTLLGLVMIYSAGSPSALSEGENAASYVLDQLKFTVLGVIALVILWRFIPYNAWGGIFVWIIWAVSVGLLLMVAVSGSRALGATRWLSLGFISLQPSEFFKITVLLMFARMLYDYQSGSMSTQAFFIQLFCCVVAPIGFMYVTQSDLGTTLICFVGLVAVAWLGEVPKRILVGVLVVFFVFGLIAVFGTGYRSDRMLFMNPWDDGEEGYGNGFQLIHSFYAFAEGGLFGVGLGNSREKYLYLPEAETDFIFAVVGEELGLVGAMVVVALFMGILWASLRIARMAPDMFGLMIAGGCGIMLVAQAFLNIGCVLGMLPTTGKPLPFLSSGGSSLIATFILIGLILSVARGADLQPSVYEQRRADLRIVKTHNSQKRSASTNRSTSRASLSNAPYSSRSHATQSHPSRTHGQTRSSRQRRSRR
ncbi:FtsW/RodA/SpoVE family cell cycle protein [Adlercreutzia agrestimuris]|uniref:FtsW/RodA/SpoVE family cell cycle protein n=1 Tax=Adlercreutzia agrestimuris TaxID=2941324 RepID=UPI00203FF4A6|nr:putative peptidoglycan glycosyltransferase FtsW [Adlercreutzia agrestimuris]